MPRLIPAFYATLAALLLALPAVASDGVIEISQTRVDANGGFPFVISSSGSYRLTSNLTVPNQNTRAIDVQADGVTVDLNGFTIRGPVNCTFDFVTPTTCSPFGIGNGVGGTTANVTVRNGIVRGMGNTGVNLTGPGIRVESLIAVSNGDRGINVGPGSVIEGCLAVRNRADGFGLAGDSTITESVAITNGSRGIVTGFGVEISRNSVPFNGSGIAASRGSVISDNAVSRNFGTGVSCTVGCLVNGNNITDNGNVGLSLQTGSGYTNNVITDHAIQPVSGGTYLSPNVCDNSTSPSVCDPP